MFTYSDISSRTHQRFSIPSKQSMLGVYRKRQSPLSRSSNGDKGDWDYESFMEEMIFKLVLKNEYEFVK